MLRTSKRNAQITAPTRRNNNDRQKRIIIVLDAHRRYTTDRYYTRGSCDRTRRYNTMYFKITIYERVLWARLNSLPPSPDRLPNDDTAAQLQHVTVSFFIGALFLDLNCLFQLVQWPCKQSYTRRNPSYTSRLAK